MNYRLLALCLLACATIANMVRHFSPGDTIDLYHFWAFKTARQENPPEIKNPYSNTRGYHRALRVHGERYLRQGGDPRFREVHQFRIVQRDKLLPTGPPLLYASFFFLPKDYIETARLYTWIQGLSFAFGIFLLCFWVLRFDALTSGLFATFLVYAFQPFTVDLLVGNFNAIQLLATSLTLLCVAHLVPRTEGKKKHVFSALFIALSVWMLLVKINVFPMVFLLWAHFFVKYWKDRKLVFTALASGVVTALVCVFASSLYFGSWTGAWVDWWNYIKPGKEDSILKFDRGKGNTSPVLLLQDTWNLGQFTAAFLILSVLTAIHVGGESLRRREEGTPLPRMFVQSLSNGLRNPHYCTAVGIIAMFALMPLVWYHYYVLFPIPVLWALSTLRDERTSPRHVACFTLLFLAIVPYVKVLRNFTDGMSTDLQATVYAMPFLPLWMAICLRPVKREEAGSEAPLPL